jgi:glycosyltransferase involved in cell wall biosynthesis
MTGQTPYYSFIVPVYNEEGNVEKLHAEIVTVAEKLNKPYEVIFIDDGSTDQTLQKLKTLSPIKILILRKNSGQSAALDAGIKAARGEILITLDGDGQNDPADVPKMLKKLNGFDVVCGWRYKRKDTLTKRFISQGAKFFRSFLVADKVHDAGCTLRIYKKECFNGLDLYGEMHRMIPALLAWNGFRLTEVKVNHRPRKAGMTKYSWQRTFKGFLDMLDVWFWRKYQARPLHLFGSAGLLLVGISFLFGTYLAIRRMFFGYGLSDKIWPLVAITGFITGIQLLVFGLLANLIIKSENKHDFYRVKKVISNS